MGTIHAKEAPNASINNQIDESEPDFANVKAVVQNVYVDGLGRTKNDVLVSAAKDLFKSEHMGDVLVNSLEVKQKLERLGCFKRVNIILDTSKGPNALANGVDVTFVVQEYLRLGGSVNTAINNNSEGSLVIGLRSPNIFGRGERVQAEYKYGSRKTNNINLEFSKPFINIPNGLFRCGLFQNVADWSWSGFKQLDRGLFLDGQFNSTYLTQHNFIWEGVIRDISALRTSAFSVREQSGPTLKSAIKHVLSVDTRDQNVFPTEGTLLSLTSELAGLGGNIGFVKNDLQLQMNFPLTKNIVVQSSLQCGHMLEIPGKSYGIADRFFLGGPLNVRGFQTRGIGPHEDQNALGTDAFWAGALHVFTPLPFRPGKGGIGEAFRTHFFVNFGNVGTVNLGEDFIRNVSQLTDTLRLAYGLGVALRIGDIARVELNYCVPVSYLQGDIVQNGMQFGIGISFL